MHISIVTSFSAVKMQIWILVLQFLRSTSLHVGVDSHDDTNA